MNVTEAGADNVIFPESEFDDASAIGSDSLLLWHEGRGVVASFDAGVCTITNTAAQTGQLEREVSDANGDGIVEGNYKLVIKAAKDTVNLQVIVHSTNINPLNGDLVNEYISDVALTEYEYPFTTTSGKEININLRVYSTISGKSCKVDYCRIVDLN
jgi:hypothetical protein